MKTDETHCKGTKALDAWYAKHGENVPTVNHKPFSNRFHLGKDTCEPRYERGRWSISKQRKSY
jgi:hypothetical protein